MGLVEQSQHLAPHFRRLVGLVEVDADGLPGECRDLAHPWPLLHRHERVVGCEAEHAATDPCDGSGDAQQLVLVGCGAGHQLAIFRLVDGRARRGETERAGAQRFFHEAGHLDDLGIGGLGVGRAAFAHHVSPQRTVRDGRADVHHPRQLLEHVEVLGVALPTPLDAFGERRAGDVLDAFHQLDQPLVTIG